MNAKHANFIFARLLRTFLTINAFAFICVDSRSLADNMLFAFNKI